LEAQIA